MYKVYKELIKVITGIRRCGKSTLLEIYKNYLLSIGINKEQIISINLEDLKYNFIEDYMSLYNYINENINTNKKNYVFIDEVQKILLVLMLIYYQVNLQHFYQVDILK